MKVIPQLAIIALIGAVAVPLSAWFVPGTRPWLDQIGLLQPLAAAGLVPSEQAEDAKGPGGANPGAGGVPVVASAFEIEPLKDVVSAIGSARGVQAVELSFEVTGRLEAMVVAPGSRVAAGAVIAQLDAETAQLAVERARLVLADAKRTADRLAQLSAARGRTDLANGRACPAVGRA